MAKKARLMLLVSDPLHSTLKRLSDLQGRSMVSICAELLEAAVPALAELSDTIERIAALPVEARGAVVSAVNDLEASLLTANEGVDLQFDLLDRAIEKAGAGA